jgi:hypothetical protein
MCANPAYHQCGGNDGFSGDTCCPFYQGVQQVCHRESDQYWQCCPPDLHGCGAAFWAPYQNLETYKSDDVAVAAQNVKTASTTTATGTCDYGWRCQKTGPCYKHPTVINGYNPTRLVVTMSGPPGDNGTVVAFNGWPTVKKFDTWTKVSQPSWGWTFGGSPQPGADFGVSYDFFTPDGATFVAGVYEEFGSQFGLQNCTFAITTDPKN